MFCPQLCFRSPILFCHKSFFLPQKMEILALPEGSCRLAWPPCLLPTGFHSQSPAGWPAPKPKTCLSGPLLSTFFSLKRRSVPNVNFEQAALTTSKNCSIHLHLQEAVGWGSSLLLSRILTRKPHQISTAAVTAEAFHWKARAGEQGGATLPKWRHCY